MLRAPPDGFGETALHYYRYKTQGCLPLHEAAKQGQCYLINSIVSVDKKFIDMPDNNGKTPLHYAAQYQKFGAMKTLLYLNADPTLRDKNGLTARDFLNDVSLKLKFDELCLSVKKEPRSNLSFCIFL